MNLNLKLSIYKDINTVFQTVKNVVPEVIIRSNSSILINNFLSLNNLQETMFLFLKDSYINIVVTRVMALFFKINLNIKQRKIYCFMFFFQFNNLTFLMKK